MTSVVAIGYQQQSTAAAAAEHLHRVTPDFLLGSDAVAVLSRDVDGVIHLATSHESPAQGRLLGLFWPPLLGPLCFGPILGTSATGPWRELERVVIQAGLVRALRAPLTDMLQPGTSVLLLAVEAALELDEVLDGVPGSAGTAASATVSPHAQRHLRWAIQGWPARRPSTGSIGTVADAIGAGRPTPTGARANRPHRRRLVPEPALAAARAPHNSVHHLLRRNDHVHRSGATDRARLRASQFPG